jgi:SAM-dependent methyltransferase
MELTKVQSDLLKRVIQDWSKDQKFELETTFGGGGMASNIFLQIAKRLRTKGFEMIPQDDRLSILTPNHIRLSLEGLGVLQDYCRDDNLQGKAFTAMFKDRAFQGKDLDIREYDIRFKVRREEELSQDDPRVIELIRTWNKQRKAFRLIRRWSFQGNGVRMDLSMVRQTPSQPGSGEFQWTSTFQERNVLNEVPRYEVEVELLHGTEYTATPELALKALIAGCGEVLRAIQNNSILIRASVANSVRMEYQAITGSDKFRGVGPVTLQLDNIKQNIDESIPNVRQGYNVTDKADGLRAMGFVNQEGELYLVDQSLNIYRTGFKNDKCAKSIVDGEWITLSKNGDAINHYMIFDIYYYDNGKKVSHLPFITFKDDILDKEGESRFNKMSEWFDKWSDGVEFIAKGINQANRLMIGLKRFEFASAGNDSIFKRGCAAVLETSRIYHTDGLILTSNSEPIPDRAGVRFRQQFKWKPSKDNTVDFLINYERDADMPTQDKITTSIQPDSDNTVQYKTMRLYVGSAKGRSYDNPRATILLQQPIVHESEKMQYKPSLFQPIEFPDTMANTAHVLVQIDPETSEDYVMTEDTKEPIPNRSIVEFRYDPSRESGWRWIPTRIRHDKTERLLRAIAKGGNIKYSGMMNDEGVANDVWNSIHNPITETMICNGTEQPTDEELKDILKIRESEVGRKYYESKASKENIALIKGLRDFHNRYIKNDILIKKTLAGGNKTLVDLACGKGGDLYKWIENRARFVMGIDISGDGITNSQDGAYKRYMTDIMKFGMDRVPKIAFAIGNSSKNIVSGEAGATPEERDILRSVFGKFEPEGPVPPYIEKVMAGSFRAGADVAACMFAIHYFFQNKETLDGFLRNLSEVVKIGGYFVGCCFDGQKIFQLLKKTEKGRSVSGTLNDVPLWTITKDYEAEELLTDDSSIGLGIDVEFISIGDAQKEYLVPFDLLTQKMATIGFALLDDKELATMGLQSSTNTFDVSYKMAERDRHRFTMPDPVKQYSFLNRWFIFKRKGAVIPEVEALPQAVNEEVSEAAISEATSEAATSEAISKAATSKAATSEAAANVVKPKNKPRISSASMPPIQLQEMDEKEQAVEPVAEASRSGLPALDRPFKNIEIFRFGPEVLPNDMLGLTIGGKKDSNIGRWMALSGRFPIPDKKDPTTLYPTVEHFLAGMKLKHASNQTELAKSLMSTVGSIHTSSQLKRVGKSIPVESGEDFRLLLDEIALVRKTISTKTNLNKYRIVINDMKWNSMKDKFLMEALQYRWENDKRFRDAVSTAKDMGKYLLYSTTAALGGSELGGVRDIAKGTISGENRVGRFIMEIADFQF